MTPIDVSDRHRRLRTKERGKIGGGGEDESGKAPNICGMSGDRGE